MRRFEFVWMATVLACGLLVLRLPAQPPTIELASTNEISRVVCPAVDQDEVPRSDYPFDSSMPISLVALGDVHRITNSANDNLVFEMEVDQALFGSCPQKVVRFTYPWNLVQTQHVIVALVPRMYDDPAPFEMKYDIRGDELELKAQTALGKARFDYRVLSAECIFVGKETAIIEDSFRKVKVVRSISGPKLDVGTSVTIDTGNYVRRADHSPTLHSNEMIFLIASIDQKKNRHGLPVGLNNGPNYSMTILLEVDQEKNVLEALKRRDAYPVVETADLGRKERCREVMFEGNADEAIALLGSTNAAAVTLGVRMLKSDQNSLKAIDRAVEAGLNNLTQRGNQPNRRLRNLIALLGDMGQGTADGAIGKFLDRFLAKLESNPPAPVIVPERAIYSHYWEDEEDQDDVNHSLPWLLMAMKEQDALDHFAQRVIRLLDRLSGPWKEEVQLALDAARVEDNLELESAKAVGRRVTPIRIAPVIRATGEAVAFSHNSRFLACGTSVWKTEDWSKAGGFEQDGSIVQLAFSPDDDFLYVAGGAGIEIHNRYDWRTGKLDRAFEGHKMGLCCITLSPDGRQMLTASFYENAIHQWDVKSGKIIKTMDLPSGCYSVALSPDGTMLARQSAAHEITIQALTEGPEHKLTLPGNDELCKIAFSPDGKCFYAATFGFASEVSMQQVVRLFAYDASAGFLSITNATQAANRCTAMAVSTDSKWLVFADQDGSAWTASLPDFKTIRPLIASNEHDSGSIAFSPDGKLLAIGSRNGVVHLFNARTFEPIEFPSGHSRNATSVYFSGDSRILRSIGADQLVCAWDVATGRMTNRFSLPPGTTCVSVRGSDGHYALCASAADVETPFWNQNKKVPPVKVIDLYAGKEVSQVELPVNWNFGGTEVLWLREPEALCFGDRRARRFNYITGEMLDNRGPESNKETLLLDGMAEIAEDGKTLYSIRAGGKISNVSLEKADVDSFKASKIGDSPLPHFTGNKRGLVPGGQYLFVGDPGMYFYDRASVKLAAQKRMKGWDLFCTAFSPHGDYYAVGAGARRIVSDNFSIYEPDVQTVIRVQETLSGKTVFAFPAHSRWIKDIKFSPDTTRLAVVTDDGFIEIWNLQITKPL